MTNTIGLDSLNPKPLLIFRNQSVLLHSAHKVNSGIDGFLVGQTFESYKGCTRRRAFHRKKEHPTSIKVKRLNLTRAKRGNFCKIGSSAPFGS